jgi:hypothetical protein
MEQQVSDEGIRKRLGPCLNIALDRLISIGGDKS